MMAGVFISYRRGDAAGYAGRLRETLERRLGEGQVFRDADTIEPGQDFVQAIETRLNECGALLALIGQQWLNAADATGHRRLDLADDFVSLEIAGALKRTDVLVVPVLVEGARMPTADELPQSIRTLAHHQAVDIRDEAWNEDVDRLVSVLTRRVDIAGTLSRATRMHGESTAQSASPLIRKVLIGGALALALMIAATLVRRLQENRLESIDATPPISGSGAPAGGGSSSTTSGSYGIEIPRLSEFADGAVTHALISGNVTPKGNINLIRLHVRLANDGDRPVNFWDQSYRLLVGDQTLAPTSNLNELVASHASKDGILSFEIPSGTAKAALRVDSQVDPPGTLPLELGRTRGVVPEGVAGPGPLTHSLINTVAEGDQPLASNRSVSYSLASVTSQRFVNALRVIFAIRMHNNLNYMQLFGSDAVRVVVSGDSIAPVKGPNEIVAGGSSSQPRDFVFDLPASTGRIVLRTTLDGATSEKPFNLGR